MGWGEGLMWELTLTAHAPCRHLVVCRKVLRHSLPGNGGGYRQVKAAKYHSLGFLCPSLLNVVLSAVSNLFIQIHIIFLIRDYFT